MIYRKLTPTGDYTFGQQSNNFYANVPAAVAQAVKTRLSLSQGEWFLDTTIGTPYKTKVLGKGTTGMYAQAIRQVILNTQGLTGLTYFSSSVDPITRAASVSGTINTQYGATPIQVTL